MRQPRAPCNSNLRLLVLVFFRHCYNQGCMTEIRSSATAPRWGEHLRALIRIAAPLSFSQLSEMAMNVTDTVLLGGLGATALAVGGMTTNLFFCTFITFQAALGGASILIARARGRAFASQERLEDLSGIVTSGVLLALLLCLPVLAILLPAGSLLGFFNEPALIVSQGSRFMHLLLWALLPNLVIIGLLRIILPAFGSERLLLWTMPGMAVMNGFLNAGLIHARFGLPRMGLWGSACATIVTGWSVAILLVILARRQSLLRPHLRLTRPDPRAMMEMLRLGLPMMGATGAELLAFQMTGLHAGALGAVSSAAHQIALSVTSTAFMISLALSQAVNIRVAYWLGAGAPAAALRATLGAVMLVVLWTCFTATILLVFPEYIAGFYVDPHGQDAAQVIPLAVTLLKIAGIFQILDGVQCVCSGALRGCHDTFMPMVLMVVTYIPVSILGGDWLAFKAGYGASGLWIGLATGLGILSVLLSIRLVVTLRRKLREGQGTLPPACAEPA
ncbi:MATE family efflux transporter [Asaia sp. As-1742]|nr:MATE family efflux transporter [Asaia sp. As-1742]